MCLRFLLKVVAPVLTSPRIRYATVATPTANGAGIRLPNLAQTGSCNTSTSIANLPKVIMKLVIAMVSPPFGDDGMRLALKQGTLTLSKHQLQQVCNGCDTSYSILPLLSYQDS